MKALILYWSSTGNTEKVSQRIADTLAREGLTFEMVKVHEEFDCNLYDYNLVFLGTPAIEFLPHNRVMDFIKKQLTFHRREGNVKLCCPKVPGKYAVCYCTYSGPHTGIREAIPTVLYMGQFFEHLGFTIVGEWYTVGEFKGIEIASVEGKLGDIRGRPNEEDLLEIENKVREALKAIRSHPPEGQPVDA
jgi:multimeric flavodoxin WrbA